MELEVLKDYDQHLFVEKGMRGGISTVSKRHAKVNNPLVEGYAPEKASSHILYLNANNLYGWAMSQPSPTGAFWWEQDCEQLAKSIADHSADYPDGFILDVDLEYPGELHKAHNAFPLAPGGWMSEYQRKLLDVGVGSTEAKKLLPYLHSKERYVRHYRILQLYL